MYCFTDYFVVYMRVSLSEEKHARIPPPRKMQSKKGQVCSDGRSAEIVTCKMQRIDNTCDGFILKPLRLWARMNFQHVTSLLERANPNQIISYA